jgi:hypothetical protein
MSRNIPPDIANIRSPVPASEPEKVTGLPPEGHVGVYVHKGRTLVGHVVRGSPAIAARFGSHFAKLGKVAGRPAWIGETLAEVSQRSTMNASRKGATDVKIAGGE